MLHPSADLHTRVTTGFYASYTLRTTTRAWPPSVWPICHCQICNFSSSQSGMAGPPRPFINNLQITVKQKMAVHRSECEPRLGLASFLSQRSIPMKNVMCHWCNCVCVCVCILC